MKTLSLIPIFLFLFLPLQAEIKIINRDNKPTIQVTGKNEQTVFSYTFTTLQNIYDVQLSPSGHYLSVWHCEKNPRKLKIFRINDEKLLADFIPGFGGRLKWTKGDKLFHAWGCGTCCYVIRTYDITGHILHEQGADGYLLTDLGFYMTFPAGSLQYFEGETHLPLTVYDANTDKEFTLPETAPFIPVDYTVIERELFLIGIEDQRMKMTLPLN